MEKQSSFYQDIILLRILMLPLKKISEKRKLINFKKHNFSERILDFKDRHSGKTCYIIGNGSSLRADDLDLLQNEFTFGVNKIFHIFDKTSWRPSFYVCVDNRALIECFMKMKSYTMPLFFDTGICELKSSFESNVFPILNRQRFYVNRFSKNRSPKFSDDCSNFIEAGETVVYNAIQLAVYMGFKKIILLGVDCNYSNVFDGRGKVINMSNEVAYFSKELDVKNENTANIIGQINAFRSAKLYCDAHNIKIYNATRGGKLEVFERVNLEEVLNEYN